MLRTSSPGRPTLEEIGVEVGQEVGTELVMEWDRHELALDASALLLFGDDVLEQQLISQGEVFPAGTAVDSDTWIALGRLAYRYRFDVGIGAKERLVVKPGVGVTSMTVHYELEGDHGGDVHRDYTHGVPHVELGLEWRPGMQGRWSLSADVRQSLYWLEGSSNQTNLFAGLLGAHFDLSRSWTLDLEGGYQHLGFEDDQALPNDIDVEFGPFVGLGISAHW